MPAPKRKDLLPRRRRHDDDGEEDGSVAGDAAGYASSEASLMTDNDDAGDATSNSGDEDNSKSTTASPVLPKKTSPVKVAKKAQSFPTTADTNAMLNGLKLGEGDAVKELHFDEAGEEANVGPQEQPVPEQRSRSQPIQPKNPKMPSQPAPNAKKGYFLHDDRARQQHTPAVASAFRGRGRGIGGPGNRGNFGPYNNETNKQWTHDLHETVNQPPAPVPQYANPPRQPAAALTAPDRSFSTTTVLGNVPVNVKLPDSDKTVKATMIKKHYTLLPQHRPPLRRDKPVRISIPDEHPRYIFPSTERSFIFIPRALRPNQQQFRGRGRGSFGGSRRTSVYGASTYTPSIGMSRRPSIAASAAGSGIHTPTGMPVQQFPAGMQKPFIRMPFPGMPSFMPSGQHAEWYMGDNSAIIHSPPVNLPMHQPVPQKSVSVADIDGQDVGGPQQQSQQPFHQQVPANMSNQQAQQNMPHIPEGAVYAQPFQPYSTMPQGGYYGIPYAAPMTMQPHYPMGMGGPVAAPVQQQQTTAGTDGQQQQGPVAHETNGMVYYYDPSQQYQPMMNMMPGPYFYPPVQQQMFYQ